MLAVTPARTPSVIFPAPPLRTCQHPPAWAKVRPLVGPRLPRATTVRCPRPVVEETRHEGIRPDVPRRPDPVRHLGQQLLPGLADQPRWRRSTSASSPASPWGASSGCARSPRASCEYLVIGSTIPWHWKFWTAPLVASCMGQRIPGYHVEQACATGLQAVLLAGGRGPDRAPTRWSACSPSTAPATRRWACSPSAARTSARTRSPTCGTTSASTPPPASAMIAAAGHDRAQVQDRPQARSTTWRSCRHEQYFARQGLRLPRPRAGPARSPERRRARRSAASTTTAACAG